VSNATATASNQCVDPYQCNAILVASDTSGESSSTYNEQILTCSGIDNVCDNTTADGTQCVCNSNADCAPLGSNYCCGTYIGNATDSFTGKLTGFYKNACI
jgi:hypothetical protein